MSEQIENDGGRRVNPLGVGGVSFDTDKNRSTTPEKPDRVLYFCWAAAPFAELPSKTV